MMKRNRLLNDLLLNALQGLFGCALVNLMCLNCVVWSMWHREWPWWNMLQMPFCCQLLTECSGCLSTNWGRKSVPIEDACWKSKKDVGLRVSDCSALDEICVLLVVFFLLFMSVSLLLVSAITNWLSWVCLECRKSAATHGWSGEIMGFPAAIWCWCEIAKIEIGAMPIGGAICLDMD